MDFWLKLANLDMVKLYHVALKNCISWGKYPSCLIRPSLYLLDSLLQEAGAICLVSSSLFQIESGVPGP